MARLSRFVTVAVLLGGATVFLSACTGGSGPIASPSPAVSTVVTPSPSVSPSPTPLTDNQLLALIPENARAENFVSASNFAKFFVRLFPSMMQNKDSQLFAKLSDPDCVFCKNALDSYQQLVVSNGSVTGGDMTIEEALASGGLEPDGTTNASFDVQTTDMVFLDGAGNVTARESGHGGRVGVGLRYDGNHWVVLGVGSESA